LLTDYNKNRAKKTYIIFLSVARQSLLDNKKYKKHAEKISIIPKEKKITSTIKQRHFEK
jgi:D-lyxose ketol-isomerase